MQLTKQQYNTWSFLFVDLKWQSHIMPPQTPYLNIHASTVLHAHCTHPWTTNLKMHKQGNQNRPWRIRCIFLRANGASKNTHTRNRIARGSIITSWFFLAAPKEPTHASMHVGRLKKKPPQQNVSFLSSASVNPDRRTLGLSFQLFKASESVLQLQQQHHWISPLLWLLNEYDDASNLFHFVRSGVKVKEKKNKKSPQLNQITKIYTALNNTFLQPQSSEHSNIRPFRFLNFVRQQKCTTEIICSAAAKN